MQNDNPTTASLDDIALELTLRPLIDDLDGIARKLPLSGSRDAAYAAFAGYRFNIGDTATRAVGFAEEIKRFLALAERSPRPQAVAFLDMLTALTVLNAASVLAVAIMPPRTGADILVRISIAESVDAALRESGDLAMIEAAALAFGFGTIPFAIGEDERASFALKPAAPPPVAELRAAEPAMLGLEQGLSLTSFMRNLPQVGTLIERAVLQLDDAERIAREIADDDHGPEALDRLERARQGASLLATADLARAGIHADLAENGAAAKERALALAQRLPEARLRSIVAFAATTGGVIGELNSSARALAGSVRIL